MKIILAIVAACVLVGTLAGYLVGRNLTEEPIFETLVSNVTVVQGANNKFTFNYVCNGRSLVSYDVDSKKTFSAGISDDELSELAKGWERNNNKKAYQRAYDLVLGFVTGGGAVRFARPLMTIVRSREANQYAVPGVLGGLSGFYLGYSISTRLVPSCDSPLPLLLSQRAATWKFVERKVADRYFLQVMGKTAFSEGNEVEDLAGKALARMNDGQFDSQTFLILASIAKYAPQEQPFSWFSSDLIIGVYFPVAVLLGVAIGAGVLLLSRSVRLASAKRNKSRQQGRG